MDLLNMPVTLVVKAPSQKFADQTVECGLGWTIRQLKKHLSNVYPNKPHETQQKLVYSGKLLQDDSVLKDVLRQHENIEQVAHTLHLVCSHDMDSSAEWKNSADKKSEVRLSQNTAPVTSSSMSTSTSPLPMTTDGLRQRSAITQSDTNTTQTTTAATDFTSTTSGVHHPAYSNMPYTNYSQYGAYPTVMHQQMAMMNYWYTQSIAQYMQLYQHQQSTMTFTSTTAQVAPHIMPQVGLQQPHMPVNQPHHGGGGGVVGNQPVGGGGAVREDVGAPQVLNAQGGAADDDDIDMEGRRDWLDWVYVFIRFCFLVTLLYYYSPLDQFIFVVCGIFLLYVYQSGYFQLMWQRLRGTPEPRQAQSQSDESNDPNNEGENNEGPAQSPVEPPKPSIFSVILSFFVSFFTSLVPQPPQPVNQN